MHQGSGDALFVEQRYKCLADAQLRREVFRLIKIRFRVVLRGLFDRLSIRGRKGAQRVLYFQAQLREYAGRYVRRILRTEKDAHSLAADELDDGKYLLQEGVPGFLED